MAAGADRDLAGEQSKFYEAGVDELIIYAEFEFARSRPMHDGATEGHHLDSAKRQLALMGKGKPKATVPEGLRFPEELTHIWNWFVALLNGCASSGFGPAMLTWCDLHAWSEMTGNRPQPWEVDALMRLGTTYVAVRSKKAGEK